MLDPPRRQLKNQRTWWASHWNWGCSPKSSDKSIYHQLFCYIYYIYPPLCIYIYITPLYSYKYIYIYICPINTMHIPNTSPINPWHPMTIAACASAAAAAASARARLPEPMGPLNSNAVRLAMVEKWVGNISTGNPLGKQWGWETTNSRKISLFHIGHMKNCGKMYI